MPSPRLSPEERVLASVKYLDLTLSGIEAKMDVNGGTLEEPLRVKGLRGELRLGIPNRHSSETSWSMALILNSTRFDGRIDCIDWEPLFVSIDGPKCTGFHRHAWNAKAMSCDRFKLPLPQFKPANAEDFIELVACLQASTVAEQIGDTCVITLPIPTVDGRVVGVFVESRVGDYFLVSDGG